MSSLPIKYTPFDSHMEEKKQQYTQVHAGIPCIYIGIRILVSNMACLVSIESAKYD